MISGPEHWLRTRVQLLAHVRFTAIYDVSSGDPAPSSDLCRYQVHVFYTDTHAEKAPTAQNKII